MNGTFMFGADRFGPEQDYHATYRSVGGRNLDAMTLQTIMASTCDALLRDYDSPECIDHFPSLAEAFARNANAPAEELPFLERLFAAHEIGEVPAAHAAFLHALSQTHHLGIVSNLCARPEPWLTGFRASGL